MNTDKTYNGWSSYETWVVNLWLDNDEGSQSYWSETTKELLDQHGLDRTLPEFEEDEKSKVISDLEDMLKDQHEDSLPELTGFAADLLNAAMSEVNWREIATSFVESAIQEA